jgi:translation initiation factor 2 beta subunit (eIF-2beta)/eIF-5
MKRKTFLYKEINDNREKLNTAILELINHTILPKFHKNITGNDLQIFTSNEDDDFYMQFLKMEHFVINIYVVNVREKAKFIMDYKRRIDKIEIITNSNETIEAVFEELTNELMKATIKQIFIK